MRNEWKVANIIGAVLLSLVFCTVTVQGAEKKEKKEDKATIKDLPKAVQDAIKKRFQKAEIMSVEKETEKKSVVYEVELKSDGKKYEIEVNANGKILEIEEKIAFTDLPKDVQSAVKKRFPKAVVTEAKKESKGNSVFYEIELKAGKKEYEVTVDSKGKILEVEEEDDDDDKDDDKDDNKDKKDD